MFIYFNNKIINADNVYQITTDDLISKGCILIHYNITNGFTATDEVHGSEAFNIVMQLAPNALEGKQAKYAKHAWAIHNLFGHPLMQIFSWLHLTNIGIKIHDLTMPDPKL